MFKHYYINNFNNLALPAGTNVATGVEPSPAYTGTPITLDTDADFEALKMAYVYTDPRVFLRLKEVNGRYYDADPGMDARLACGTLVNLGAGGNALALKALARPLLIPKGARFTADMADFSGAQNSVRVAVHGTKLYNGNAPWDALGRKYKRVNWWTEPVYSGSITANKNALMTISAPYNQDFYIYRILAQRTGAATVAMQNFIGNLQNTDTHIDNLAGNVEGHNILPAPIFIPADSSLLINITDISGATNGVTLHLEGEQKEF